VGIRPTARVRPPGRSLLDEYELAPNEADAAIHFQVIGHQLAALVAAISNAARRTATEYSLLRIPLSHQHVDSSTNSRALAPGLATARKLLLVKTVTCLHGLDLQSCLGVIIVLLGSMQINRSEWLGYQD
jgi:hypothetical protein